MIVYNNSVKQQKNFSSTAELDAVLQELNIKFLYQESYVSTDDIILFIHDKTAAFFRVATVMTLRMILISTNAQIHDLFSDENIALIKRIAELHHVREIQYHIPLSKFKDHQVAQGFSNCYFVMQKDICFNNDYNSSNTTPKLFLNPHLDNDAISTYLLESEAITSWTQPGAEAVTPPSLHFLEEASKSWKTARNNVHSLAIGEDYPVAITWWIEFPQSPKSVVGFQWVNSRHRGQGLGKILHYQRDKFVVSANISHFAMTVVVQNIASVSLALSGGYRIQSFVFCKAVE